MYPRAHARKLPAPFVGILAQMHEHPSACTRTRTRTRTPPHPHPHTRTRTRTQTCPRTRHTKLRTPTYTCSHTRPPPTHPPRHKTRQWEAALGGDKTSQSIIGEARLKAEFVPSVQKRSLLTDDYNILERVSEMNLLTATARVCVCVCRCVSVFVCA